MNRRQYVALAVGLLFVLPGLLPWRGAAGDVELFASYAERLLAGGVPYRDVAMEYPPVAVLLFCVPRWLAPATAYKATFIVLVGAVDAAWKWAAGQTLAAARRLGFWALCTAAGAALYYTYLKRFDVVVAAATVAVVAGTLRRPAALWPWALGGLAVCAKLYPVVLAPLLVAHGCSRGVSWRRQAAQGAVALGGVVAVLGGTYAWAGPASLDWWRFHQERGLHLASTYSAVAMAWRGWGRDLPIVVAFGSWQVTAPWAAVWALRAPAVGAMALVATALGCVRACRTPAGLWRGASAMVIALLLTSKVFSPQYMIWLIPLLAMATVTADRVDVRLGAVLLVSCVLTAMTYPNEYRLAQGQVSKQVCLLARDGVLFYGWARCVGARNCLYLIGAVLACAKRRVLTHGISDQENIPGQQQS